MKRLIILIAALMLITTGCHKDKVEPVHSIVTYYGNGGLTASGESSVKDVELGSGRLTIKDNMFTNENKEFKCWNTKSDGNGNNLHPTDDTFLEELNLYAIWLNKYTITFNPNGGTGTMSPQTVVDGVPVNLHANAFTRNGYSFKCWNTKANGSGTSYNDKANISPTSDMTLYAQWKKTHTITFNANGGSGTMSPQTVLEGESTQLRSNTFTKSNYTFKGWNTKSDGTGNSYNNNAYICLSSDVTLYAQWIYNFNGGSINMQSGWTDMELGAYYKFYDSGGPNGNYSNHESKTYTFYAPPGKRVKIVFDSFRTEYISDYMILNGGGTWYSGTNNPGTVYSSGNSFSIYFYSDFEDTFSGWSATVYSID